MKQTVVEMEKIKVHRGNRFVLNIEQLSVNKGELIAVVGPNGAGKSTLLKVLNLLIPYDQGSLKLFGNDVRQHDLLSLRRRCSMVFQDSLLLDETVFDNVSLPLRLRGMDKQKIKKKVQTTLEAFHCLHLAQREAQCLSGGEAQRVSLARSLVYSPELLLLDESFVALDVSTRVLLLADLKKLARSLGITVLFISHNYNDVLYFSERVLVLFKGQIIQEDCPERIMRRPVNQAVAELTGMDNILPCSVEKVDDIVGSRVTLAQGVQFDYPGPVPTVVTACCLPGDSLCIFDSVLSVPVGWTTFSGVVCQVVPGIGVYQVTVEVREILFSVRVPREQATRGMQPGLNVQVAFQLEEVQLL